jgi:hypothetical protein
MAVKFVIRLLCTIMEFCELMLLAWVLVVLGYADWISRTRSKAKATAVADAGVKPRMFFRIPSTAYLSKANF